MARYSSSKPASRSITSIQATALESGRPRPLRLAVGCPPRASDAVGPWKTRSRRGVMGTTASGGAGFGGRRVKHVVPVSFPTPGAPGPSGGGAVMRRSTAVAALGGVVTVAAGAWVALVEGDVVTDKHVAGVPLARAAIGAVTAGLVLLVG